MTVQPNGTHARDIALHFINVTDGRATSAIMAKTVSQAKNILKSGYTKEEIIKVIDHIIEKGINMYSFGYVSTCINDVLREIKEKEERELVEQRADELRKEQEQTQAEARKAVVQHGESTQRNREKARRFGAQSRFREKFNFDMFEE